MGESGTTSRIGIAAGVCPASWLCKVALEGGGGSRYVWNLCWFNLVTELRLVIGAGLKGCIWAFWKTWGITRFEFCCGAETTTGWFDPSRSWFNERSDIVDDDGMILPSISLPTDSASNSGSGCSSVSMALSILRGCDACGCTFSPARLEERSDFRGWSSSARIRLLNESGLAMLIIRGCFALVGNRNSRAYCCSILFSTVAVWKGYNHNCQTLKCLNLVLSN